MAIEQQIFWIPGTSNSLLLLEGAVLATGTRRMDRDGMGIVICSAPMIVRRLLFNPPDRDHVVRVPDELNERELAALRQLGVHVTSDDFQRQRAILNGQQWHLTGVPRFPALDGSLRRLPDGLRQAQLFG